MKKYNLYRCCKCGKSAVITFLLNKHICSMCYQKILNRRIKKHNMCYTY
jgi:hypothetical protein